MKSFKIAIYSGEVPSTTFIDRLVDVLAKKGHVVYLFGKKKGKVPSVNQVIPKTYSNKWHKLLQVFKYSLLLVVFKPKEKKRLDTIIENEFHNMLIYKVKFYPVLYHKPDIFHMQWAKSVREWMWVKDFGMKLVLSLRGTHITVSPLADATLQFNYETFFPQIDAFHAVSKAIKKEAVHYGAVASKIKVIYSGYDFKGIPYTTKKQSFASCIKILSVGRSHWIKGYNFALDALKIVKAQAIDFEYTIIGSHDSEELIYQIEQLELSNNVKLLKSVANNVVYEAILNADILLLPSVAEGIANVAIEAMALGTLVASSDCNGMDELITDGREGFLFQKRNPASMAESLKRILALDANQRQLIAQNARLKVEAQHDQSTMVQEFEALYNAI